MADKVLLDLSSPQFLDVFFELDAGELGQVIKALKKIRSLDWPTFMRHSGSKWEQIDHITAPNKKPAHSFRLSQKYRALAWRDGNYLRVISLHLDHDSAYRR